MWVIWLVNLSIVCGSILSAPVYFSGRDIFVNANISRISTDGSVEYFQRNVTLTPSQSVIQSSRLDWTTGWLVGLTVSSSSPGSPEIPFLGGEYLSIYTDGRIYMPIGFHSHFLSFGGSVSVLKPFNLSSESIGRLVIGWTQNFSDACIQESIMEIFMDSDSFGQPDVFHARFGLFNRSSNSPVSITQSFPISVVGWEKLMSLPADLVAQIERLLIANGAVRFHGSFRNCPFSTLPELKIVLDNRPNNGFISVAPDEYFEFDNLSQSCTPRYRANRNRDRLLYFNPLLLRDVNVRFTEQSFALCDAL